MRIHWAVCAFVCALVTLSTNLAAQAVPASNASQPALSSDDLARWGPYGRLAGQTMKDIDPKGYRLHWRWETPGQVLLEEWHGGTVDPDKPAYVMTIRLGPQPGTFNLKSSTMMGKEWVGTLQPDGSINYVGKGILKLPYNTRVDENGDYVQADTKGRTYRYASIKSSETPTVAKTSPQSAPAAVADATPKSAPAAVADASPKSAPPAPVVTTAPPAVTSEKPAPVVAQQKVSPPAAPVKAPRKLSEADLARLQQSVQKSGARSIEQARQAELRRQEAARQAALQAQMWAEQEAYRQADEAAFHAESEADSARRAAAWRQSAQENEQALADSTQRLHDTTARIQAQHAEALARQRAQADAQAADERRRQAELIRQANQRQQDEAARLAAQRQQDEQQRVAARAAEQARQPQPSAGSAASAGAVASARRASTDTDANRCVSQSEIKQDATFKGNTAAYVVNGCDTKVDVRICLLADSGWKCGATLGLVPQARWSYSAFKATGPVFVDARTTGSSRQFASPN